MMLDGLVGSLVSFHGAIGGRCRVDVVGVLGVHDAERGLYSVGCASACLVTFRGDEVRVDTSRGTSTPLVELL